MVPTQSYIKQKFNEFNRQMFGGKLPPIPIEMSDAKTFLGKCVFKRRRNSRGELENYDFKLRINTRADLPEQEVEDTLIHEMIHYYIGYYHLEDVSTHGPVFIKIMNAINKQFGRHITVSFKGSAEQREQLMDKRQHYHVVAVVKFHDGKSGIKVLPRILQRILHYYNAISSVREVASVNLFMSNNIFFNRFPNSSALKVHFLDEEVIVANLKDAEPLPCDGKTIQRTR